MDSETVGERAIAFYLHGERPEVTVPDVEVLDPFADAEVARVTRMFYERFYGDEQPRAAVIGINPGRFGGGLTGLPFTDPVALRAFCGIESSITGQRELSSVFIYHLIERMGGPESFFSRFLFMGALPFGLVSGRKNLNYYDRRDLLTVLEPYMVRTIQEQFAFGARRDVAVVLGTGKNYRELSRLNAEHGFVERLLPIDHPRFVMQYRLKRLDEYLDRYIEILNAADR